VNPTSGESLLVMIGNKKFDRHRLEDAQMIRAPTADTDEKNPFSLCVDHICRRTLF